MAVNRWNTVDEVIEARSYYHRVRTNTRASMHKRRLAERAVTLLNEKLVDLWLSRRTPPPAPAREICIGDVSYTLIWSNGTTHRYVPSSTYVPGSFRMVVPDERARLLAELNTSEKLNDEFKTALALGDEPDEPLNEEEIA